MRITKIRSSILGVFLLALIGLNVNAQPVNCNAKESCLELQNGKICDLAGYCSTLTNGPGYTAECVQYGEARMNALGYDMDRFFIRYTPTVRSYDEVLVAVHGGGYSCGKACNRESREMAEYWAERGREVVLVEYRRGYVNGVCICGCPEDKTDYCNVPFVQIQQAETLANKDFIAAVEYYHENYPDLNGDMRPLVLFGNSAGASIIFNMTIGHESWANENNIIGAMPKSGLIPAMRPIVNTSIPLYIVHHDCDNLVPYHQYYPYRNLAGCTNYPLAYGGRHIWDVYNGRRNETRAAADEGWAMLKTICGAGHGDANNDTPTSHTIDGFQYFNDLKSRNETNSFWAENHILYQEKDGNIDYYDNPMAAGCSNNPNCCATGNCVSIRESSSLDQNTIGFGPNPVNTAATIGIRGLETGSKIRIFDAQGRLAGEQQYSGTSLELCDFNLRPGLHIMTLESENGSITNHKLVVAE